MSLIEKLKVGAKRAKRFLRRRKTNAARNEPVIHDGPAVKSATDTTVERVLFNTLASHFHLKCMLISPAEKQIIRQRREQ